MLTTFSTSVALLLTLLAVPTVALDTFITYCTLPPNSTESFYVSPPNSRGSLQIAWTCLSTLILCTYSVLHLNVPKPRPDGSYSQSWRIWSSSCFAVLTIFAPECLLTESIWDLKDAIYWRNEVRETHGVEAASWTLTHMFYANMGGLLVRDPEEAEDANPYILKGKFVSLAISDNVLPRETSVSRDEILDKSKSDLFTKSLAVLQILYFYLEFFARIARRLPVTQLELTVAGVAVYALASYFCLLEKPKNVNMPTTIKALKGNPTPTEAENDNTSTYSNITGNNYATSPSPLHIFRQAYSEASGGGDTHTEASETDRDNFFAEALRAGHTVPFGRFFQHDSALFTLCLVSVPLGAIHLAAWNFHFPTTADAWLWRAASSYTTLIGPVWVFGKMIVEYLVYGEFAFDTNCMALDADELKFWLYGPGLGIILYFIGRCVLLVEMARCLFFLEPQAFETVSWTLNVPHIG